MQDSTSEQLLGPPIKYQNGEIRYPYAELKRMLKEKGVVKKPHYDAIVVLGEGPPKDIIFSDEATPEQLKEWKAFIENPLQAEKEPNFRIINVSPRGASANGLDKNPYYTEMKEIDNLVNTIQAQEKDKETLKKKLRDKKRKEWQKKAHYSKKRWGEMNASAAGYLLYIGVTEKLILTGGKTGGTGKPSEAELMRDKIITQFGRLMFRKRYGDDEKLSHLYKTDPEAREKNIPFETYKEELYQRFIKEEIYPRIILEEEATNTNTNIINIAGMLLREQYQNIGLITSSHHLERAATFLTRITGIEADTISAQRVLEMVGEIRNKSKLVEIAREFQIPQGLSILSINDIVSIPNPDLRNKIKNEITMTGYLNDDSRLPFWLSQVLSNVNNLFILTKIFEYLGESPNREQMAKKYFDIAGLDYNHYKTAIKTGNLSEEDIKRMQEAMRPLNDYQKYRQYSIEKLLEIYYKN